LRGRQLAITRFGRDGDRQRARDAGFDRHMTKPVDPRVLPAFIARRSAEIDEEIS
jgi:CheY-like chemotaxis protein